MAINYPCLYEPQISPGNTNLTPMPATAPVTLVRRETILLEFPHDVPTTTLELRSPEFNDKLVKKFTRIYRKSRGNTLIVFRDPAWPKTDIINWAFRGLTNIQAADALAFYKLSAGKYIRLTTYESLVYQGIIINPNNPISQEGPDVILPDPNPDNCTVNSSFTLKFDFQGSLVS